MWAFCTSMYCLYSLTPALEWLLKPTQRRVICGPSPPKQFQAFPFTRPFFSIQSTSLLHTWIPFLATTPKASLRAPAGRRGLLPPLAHFLCKGQMLCPYDIHQQHPCPSQSAAGVPRQGPRAQSREQSSACTAMHSTGSVQLHSRWTFLLLNDGKGRDYFASPWRVFRLHPEHMSQIFPCSQDNFRDKGLFNSAKLWRLFYTMYNRQIFMRLTSEFKHTLVVQRCD